MTEAPQDFMTSAEAAAFLRVSKKRLQNLASAGQIPYMKLGRSNRFSRTELTNYLNANRRGPTK